MAVGTIPGGRRFAPSCSPFLITSAALVAACATSRPAGNPADAGAPADPYPEDRYLAEQGCGPDAEAAGQAARARVAERVEARIESEWTSLEETSSRDGGGDRFRAASRVRMTSRFEDADLVRVDRDRGVRQADRVCVTAFVRREDALQRLSDRWNPVLDRLRLAAGRARDAAAAGSVEPFAAASAEVEATLDDLARLQTRWRTFAGKDAPGWDQVVAMRRETREAADRIRAAVRVLVHVQPTPDARAAEVGGQLVAVLGELGLAAERLAQPACPPATAGAWLLLGRVDEPCRRASLGEVCTARIRLDLRPCREGAGSREFFAEGDAPGAHPRDAALALARARARLAPEILRRELRKALEPVMPVR